MKNSLGKIKWMLLILMIWVHAADDFTSKITFDKPTPYIKEPVVITVDLTQTNHDKIIFFKLIPKKSDAYELHRLDTKESDTYHAAKVQYLYLLYPLRSGEINVTFDLIESITTDEKLAYSVSGDRDNIKRLNAKNISFTLDPIKLQVKALPQGTTLVGDFQLSHQLKNHKAKAYEPLPLTLTLKGKGYTPGLFDPIRQTDDFILFKEKPLIKVFHTKEGTANTITYPMALSATQNFDLAGFTIKAFNPKSEKSYELTFPAQHFNIKAPKKQDLVDKVDLPKPARNDFTWITSLAAYLLVFVAGFFSAKIIRFTPRAKTASQIDVLTGQIRDAKDAKELLQLLLATNDSQYASGITILEKALYSNDTIDLKKIKKEISTQLNHTKEAK
ncbi:MAG: BatD family protein [Campylobacterales bacterium]|nr:BatD family protein [Campylobacterales bacterium]